MNSIAHFGFLPEDGMAADFPGSGEKGQSTPVFERLGTIVRALHDTLREIGADGVLADAASEFPSARDRLLHIATLTENAANIVLGKVEENSPVQARLARDAASIALGWEQAGQEGALAAAPPELVARTRHFLTEVQTGCSDGRAALSDIMMAQDFQDLTGQLIKKVVALMERTENELLRLLIDAAPPGTIVLTRPEELTAGPGAPGGTALDQESVDKLLADDVGDLLADLGF